MKQNLEKLKIIYFFVFALSAFIIAPTHLFPQPLFMDFRFPHYLEMMKPFLGISWPMSFEIYHYILYVLVAIESLNVLGIIFYPKLKQIAIASSLAGLLLMSLMILFFFFIFINVNASTAIAYGFYSIILLFVDLLTLKILIKR
ncbi:MAG: hypothetical protein Q7R51_02015 [bacterium]|nr:hypothetical protein [bacterium]